MRAMARLGINIVNRENILDYFNLYDYDRTGRINYKDFVTEIFTPMEMKRRRIMEEEKTETGGEKQITHKRDKRKYNLTSTGFRQKIEQNLEDNANLIKKIKTEILSQGANTLFDIQKTINRIDVDNSGRIDTEEFNKICSEYNLNLIPDEIKTIFSCFDPSRTGKIYYQDFLNIIHGSLNDFRMGLVDQLYNQLNKNNRANIEVKTILSSFNDKRMGQEQTDDFKDNFLSHHDYFGKGKTEVTYEEFVNFFEVLSINFKEDSDFEKYMNNAFNLQTENKDEENNNAEENNDKEEENKNENKEYAKEILESIDKLRVIISKQGSKGVMNLLRNLRNVDLVGSNGVDLDEFITVIQNVLKDSDESLPVKEIHNIFNVYDIQEKGIMEYKKFLEDLFKLKSMPKSRKDHLSKIFDHLDFERKQALDINELISLYKKPEENEPNPVPDLLETFVIFHNIIRGTRNPLVNLEDFIEYYNYINFLIPESKNDKIFIDFTGEGWRLNDKSFDERKNLANNKIEGLGKQKNREAMNKLIGTNTKIPYGTIKDKINYNLNEEEATIKYNVNKIEDLVAHLRSNFIQRGPRGLMSIKRTFMLIDENGDKKISFNEFEKMFKRYRFNISQIEINNLFNYFDKDGSGFIDYGEFIGGIVGDLSEFRKNILKQVFEKLDKDETGFITVGQLREAYNPKGHPLVRQGKRSEDEILGDFIDVLEYHFSLLNEKNEENVDVNDIKIDFEDFCDFYKTISICIEEDKYFEIMVMSEWGIKKEGKSLYQRTWNQQEA